MEINVVVKNLETGVMEHVRLNGLVDWDSLEEKFGEDIGHDFRVAEVAAMEADMVEVERALYKVESLDELQELSDRLNDVDEETLEAFLEIWDLDTSLSLLESGDYQLYSAKDEDELGREICDEGYYDVPEELEAYIDYESLGRDYSMTADGGFTFLGFVEAI